jgi:hypothetical protein
MPKSKTRTLTSDLLFVVSKVLDVRSTKNVYLAEPRISGKRLRERVMGMRTGVEVNPIVSHMVRDYYRASLFCPPGTRIFRAPNGVRKFRMTLNAGEGIRGDR